MTWNGLAKFVTGFVLAIAFLFFTGVSVTRYLITQLTAPPPRPTFPNDAPADGAPVEPEEVAEASTAAQPTPSPTPTPTPTEPGAYQALVTQPIGLIVRQEPGQDSEQVGGVEYNQEVTILEESQDGEWLRVRLSNGGLEGWVKSGNTERID